MDKYQHSGDGTRGNHRPGLGERVEHIGSGAQQVFAEARDAVADLRRRLDFQGRMERHPYAILAGAAAVGYVLGGGLLTALTGRLIRVGLKVAALPLIKDELFNIAESTLSGIAARSESANKGRPSSSAGGESSV
jgi:hypothetical protein